MKLIKSLIPELIYVVGMVIVFFSMWAMTSFVYAAFLLGTMLFVVAAYLDSVMRSEKRA